MDSMLWMVFSLLSPMFAIIGAAMLFVYQQPHRVPALAYTLAIAVAAIVGYSFGLVKGIDFACSPPAPNLCGLEGFFVYGPLMSSLTMIAVGALVLLVVG
jgi:hypothetical protein